MTEIGEKCTLLFLLVLFSSSRLFGGRRNFNWDGARDETAKKIKHEKSGEYTINGSNLTFKN